MGTWSGRSPPLLAVELVCRRGLLFEQFAWPRCRATLQFYEFWGSRSTHTRDGEKTCLLDSRCATNEQRRMLSITGWIVEITPGIARRVSLALLLSV